MPGPALVASPYLSVPPLNVRPRLYALCICALIQKFHISGSGLTEECTRVALSGPASEPSGPLQPRPRNENAIKPRQNRWGSTHRPGGGFRFGEAPPSRSVLPEPLHFLDQFPEQLLHLLVVLMEFLHRVPGPCPWPCPRPCPCPSGARGPTPAARESAAAVLPGLQAAPSAAPCDRTRLLPE